MPEAAIANARTASPAQLEERYASAAKHAEAAMQRAATPQHAPRRKPRRDGDHGPIDQRRDRNTPTQRRPRD